MDVEKIIRIKHLEWTVNHLEFRYLRGRLDEEKLYKGDPKLLMVIASKQGRSQAEIAKCLNIKPATLTVMIQRMENAALIRREADKKDMRTLRVFLTDKGTKISLDTYNVFRSTMKTIYEGLTDEELEHYMAILKKIHGNLTNMEDVDWEQPSWDEVKPHI